MANPSSPFHHHYPPPPPASSTPLFPLRPNSLTTPPPVPRTVRFKRRLARHRHALHNHALTFASCVLVWLSIRALFLHDLRPFCRHPPPPPHSSNIDIASDPVSVPVHILRGHAKQNNNNNSNTGDYNTHHHHHGDVNDDSDHNNIQARNGSSKQIDEKKLNGLPRRVFSTAALRAEYNDDQGKPRFPATFLWPPEYGKRSDLSVLDIGANGGDVYTLEGWTHGHSVLAFEASPSVQDKFRATMHAHGVRFAEADVVKSSSSSTEDIGGAPTSSGNGPPYKVRVMKTVYDNITNGAGNSDGNERNRVVVLLPYGLANMTGTVSFVDKADCRGGVDGTQIAQKCGKTNRIVSVDPASAAPLSSGGNNIKAQPHEGNSMTTTQRRHNPFLRTVDVFRFDDLLFDTTSNNNNTSGIAMIDLDSIWFVKIDVEGFETEVLRGMRHFLAGGHVRYVTVEFSPNGRSGSKWGIELLEELRDAGFVCYHVRGFGQCHDSSVRSSSRACNFPFVGGAQLEGEDGNSNGNWKGPSAEELRAVAPTFEQYVDVFVVDGDSSSSKGARMSDLMCRREEA